MNYFVAAAVVYLVFAVGLRCGRKWERQVLDEHLERWGAEAPAEAEAFARALIRVRAGKQGEG